MAQEISKSVELTIPGQPPAKSSSRVIIWNKKTLKPMVRSSDQTVEYEKMFAFHVKPKHRILGEHKGDLCVRIVAYMRDRRTDIDNVPKAVLDCLQRCGVIRNDNQVSELYVKRFIDKDAPRVVATVWAV